MSTPLLEVENLMQECRLSKKFLQPAKVVHAVNDVSFTINRGEVFSIVGESGCGKSTTARTIIKLLEPTAGAVRFDGADITHFDAQQMLPFRRRMQMVFQNPYASLNPRHTILSILSEPMLFHGLAANRQEATEKSLALLDKVGLRPEQAERFPHQFSGGQRQRISVARALASSPEFIIADEPVSALDVSIQAQILNLMMDLREEFNLSYLFIAHDLAVVKHISDRLGVMYLGKLVEVGSKQAIYGQPLHPYTQALFASVPVLGSHNLRDTLLAGDVPVTPTELPAGCFFAARCPSVMPVCRQTAPALVSYGTDHACACHLLGKAQTSSR
jgi:peptide/nickel transport system ATP-binding protein